MIQGDASRYRPGRPLAGGQVFPQAALVLAGGLGTRLRAAVADRPKVLALAAGRPFLDYVLSYLAGEGIRRVTLCTGYLADQVRAFAGDGRRWRLDIGYSVETSPLGTGGALRRASQGLCQPFFALNGDTLFTANLHELAAAHFQAGGALASIALLAVEDGQGRGCVHRQADGKIEAFVEKPACNQAALINAGVYLLDPQAFAAFPVGQAFSLERDIFPRLAAEGRLYGLAAQGYFADIGTPESLAAFERDSRAGLVPVKGDCED